jgi:hypothetical protein
LSWDFPELSKSRGLVVISARLMHNTSEKKKGIRRKRRRKEEKAEGE